MGGTLLAARALAWRNSRRGEAALDAVTRSRLRPPRLATKTSTSLGSGVAYIRPSARMRPCPASWSRCNEGSGGELHRKLGKRTRQAGVTVNTVIPGATAPGMAERTPARYREMFEKASPFNRIGTAGEIAEVVAFVLVHGAGHGGWCYQWAARLLAQAGHEVHAPTLTGLADRAHLLGHPMPFAAAGSKERAYGEIHSGHVVMLSDPDKVAEMLLSLA